jgi:hypothetical protein
VVTNGTGTYICVTAHTSGVFATDLAAGKWVTLFDSVNYAAANVTFTPTGTVAATNVQSAIAEVALEALQKAANLSDVASAATARANIAVPSMAEIQNSTDVFAVAGGTVDAITGAYTPTVTALTNGMKLKVECGGANVSTTPTFKADGTPAKTIVRPDGSVPLAGDIAGANYHAEFEYDASLDKWILLNPVWQGPTPGAASSAFMSNGPGQQPSFQAVSVSAPTTGYGFLNRALNGDFRVDQIKEGAAYNINGVGPTNTVDGWSGFGIAAAGVFTVAREQSGIYTGEYNMLVSCTTADAAIAAGDLYGVYTDLEGYDVADWLSGTATPATITISFEVKSAVFTGTLGISVVNSAVNRAYVGTFSVNATGTIERKTVTLTLDTAGAWLTTNGTGLRVRIALAAGTTYQGVAGAWGNTDLYTTNAQSNFMSVNTNVLRLGRFQIEKGTVATPLERVPLPIALARAQRFYAKTMSQGVAAAEGFGINNGVINGGDSNAANGPSGGWFFPVPMRTTPTIVRYCPRAGGAATQWSSGGAEGVNARTLYLSATSVVIDNGGVALALGLVVIGASANARLS